MPPTTEMAGPQRRQRPGATLRVHGTARLLGRGLTPRVLVRSRLESRVYDLIYLIMASATSIGVGVSGALERPAALGGTGPAAADHGTSCRWCARASLILFLDD